MSLEKLLEQRATLQANLQALADADTLTEVQEKEWETVTNDIKALDAQIKRKQDAATSAQSGQTATALASATPQTSPLTAPPANNGLNPGEDRDLQAFSFTRAFAHANDRNQPLDGLEAEMHQEAQKEAREAGVPLASSSIGVPQIVLEAGATRRAQNSHTATGGTSGDQGGVLIQTEVRPFIEILMERLQLRALGATFLPGLEGNVKFPRAIRSAAKPTAKPENGTADELTVTFGSFDLTPKRIPAFMTVSDQLLMQTAQSVEAWLRNYLATEVALKVDLLALIGDGTGDNPLGLLNQTGINIGDLGTDGGALTRAALYAQQRRLKDNKARMGNWQYLLTPGTEEKLQNTLVDSGSGKFVIDESNPGRVAGMNYQYSHILPENGAKGSGTGLHSSILGNWSSMLLAQWGGLTLKKDDVTGIKEGLSTLVATTYMDTNVEQPSEFDVYSDIDLAI